MTNDTYEKMKYDLEKLNNYYFSNMTNFVSSGKERCGIDLQLEWEDKNLVDYIDFNLPEITYSYKTNSVVSDSSDKTLEYINKINTFVKKFNERKIDFFTFKSHTIDLFKQLEKAKENTKIFYVHDHDYDELFYYAKTMAIYGFGGMGKSHFLWECQKQIQNMKKYSSLFIYGKFYKEINIPWDELIEYSKSNEFLLVIDGINEISNLDTRKLIYDRIKQIKECKYARVIVSYRTYSLIDNIASKPEADYLNDLMDNTINFSGVDFESSLDRLIEVYKVDASYFYSILYSNNPMQIRMLIESDILNDKQLYDDFKYSPVKSLTFIYERFIERSCTKIWKQQKGTAYWKEIKNLAQIMYYKNRSFFMKDEISNLIKNKDQFIRDLINGGFIYDYEDINYYLSWEQLSNSIIARTFYKDIHGKSKDDVIYILKAKIKKFRRIAQALILVLVEKYENNFEDFIYVIRNVVDDEFDLSEETLLSIIINNKNIREKFQKMWHINFEYALSYFAGIPNRVFNAESYVYNYIIRNKIQYIKPSYTLKTSDIQRRLKNNLYNLNGNHLIKSNLEEFLKFAISCLFIQNTDIIELAEKTIYDIIEYNDFDAYNVFSDCADNVNSKWVERSLFNVIISLSQEKREKYSEYIQRVFSDKYFYNAKVLTRACKNLNMSPYYYVQLLKDDLFKLYKPIMITEQNEFDEIDSFGGVIWEIRNYKKFYSLNMEHYNDLRLNFDLLDEPKKHILQYNDVANKLIRKFNICDCKIDIHTRSFESLCESIPHLEWNTLDQQELFWGFICHLRNTFNYYKVTDDELEEYRRERRNYPYSRFRYTRINEIIEICVEEYIGSLMCNYLQNIREVAYWENKIYLGYLPIEYSPDRDFNIHSPIRVLNEDIQYLDEKVIERIKALSPNERNREWADNLTDSLNNVIKVLKPYKDKNGIEWVLLSCHINYKTYSTNKIHKHYDIPFDSEDCIILNGTCHYRDKKHLVLDRYKTIELNDYKGSLNDYCLDICDFSYDLNSIKANSDLWGNQNIVLPPSRILSYYKLKFDIRTSSFCDKQGDPIILCNCFDSDFHRDNIVHSVYIRKDYFDDAEKNLDLFYYCYVERYSAEIGRYSAQSDTHLIVKKGRVIQKISNGISRVYKFKPACKCRKCRVYKEYIKDKKLSKKEMVDFEVLFRDYSDDIKSTFERK